MHYKCAQLKNYNQVGKKRCVQILMLQNSPFKKMVSNTKCAFAPTVCQISFQTNMDVGKILYLVLSSVQFFLRSMSTRFLAHPCH